jgi:DNA polymerase III alpha subunit (gram-positive type)
MNAVVFDLLSNGPGHSPNTEQLLALAALRLREGAIVASFETLIQAPRPWPTWLRESDVRQAMLLPEALTAFSAFVGDDLLVAEGAATLKLPFLHEATTRRGLPTRTVRVLDLDDLVRALPLEQRWRTWFHWRAGAASLPGRTLLLHSLAGTAQALCQAQQHHGGSAWLQSLPTCTGWLV